MRIAISIHLRAETKLQVVEAVTEAGDPCTWLTVLNRNGDTVATFFANSPDLFEALSVAAEEAGRKMRAARMQDSSGARTAACDDVPGESEARAPLGSVG